MCMCPRNVCDVFFVDAVTCEGQGRAQDPLELAPSHHSDDKHPDRVKTHSRSLNYYGAKVRVRRTGCRIYVDNQNSA